PDRERSFPLRIACEWEWHWRSSLSRHRVPAHGDRSPGYRLSGLACGGDERSVIATPRAARSTRWRLQRVRVLAGRPPDRPVSQPARYLHSNSGQLVAAEPMASPGLAREATTEISRIGAGALPLRLRVAVLETQHGRGMWRREAPAGHRDRHRGRATQQ